MSAEGGFSIDQLMELAGLSVSQAGMFPHQREGEGGGEKRGMGWAGLGWADVGRRVVYKVHPPREGRKVLVVCGPYVVR